MIFLDGFDQFWDVYFLHVFFGVAGAEDVWDDDFGGIVEGCGKSIEEFVSAAVLMWLEDTENFCIVAVFLAESLEGCFYFCGVVAVVVVELGFVDFSYVLKAAAGTLVSV